MDSAKIRGYVCRIISVLLIILSIVYIILGYFVSKFDSDFELRDGLGRLLDDRPAGISFILPQWAGYLWFFIDCILLFCVILIVDKLLVRANIYLKGVKNVDF